MPETAVPPANRSSMLTIAMIVRDHVPISKRTLARMISTGQFPAADRAIGAKIRLWKRSTVEAWVEGSQRVGQ